MRIFITGVSGYAGFHAALRLAAAGHEVTGLARNPDAPRLATLRAHEIAIARGDVAEPDGYRELLERSDVVIHTLLDKKRPLETDRALFAALAGLPEHRGARRRFIYTTGCSIFGKTGVRVMDETTEPHPAHALAFRRALEIEALALNLGVVVLRPGFMYGNDGYNSVSTDWFAMAESGVAVFRGDRQKGWSWVHIDDLAEAYRLVVEGGRSLDGEVFCIADEQRPLCVDVMRACLAAAGYSGEIRFEPSLAGDNVSTWFDQNEFMTSEKARRLLGWVPRRPGVLDALPAAYAAWKAAARLQ
jgi:nucleoside-diphosphate-sugar epimerase